MLKLSECSESLPKLAKGRYKQKLEEIKCSVDPYIDDSYSYGPAPVVSYANIFVAVTVPHVMANQQMHLKVWMVSAEGWMSTLQTKVWTDAVVIKDPS